MSDEIKLVWVQVAPPRDGDQGTVEPGWYKLLADGTPHGSVQMCNESGKPLGHKRELGPKDSAQRIAARLTKERWQKEQGKLNSDFNRPLGVWQVPY
jgi:hypothetical protein